MEKPKVGDILEFTDERGTISRKVLGVCGDIIFQSTPRYSWVNRPETRYGLKTIDPFICLDVQCIEHFDQIKDSKWTIAQ